MAATQGGDYREFFSHSISHVAMQQKHIRAVLQIAGKMFESGAFHVSMLLLYG